MKPKKIIGWLFLSIPILALAFLAFVLGEPEAIPLLIMAGIGSVCTVIGGIMT